MTEWTMAERKVIDTLAGLGLGNRVVVLPELASTAEMAARAIGVEVGRIVKSLIFRGAESGKPYLLLVSGANRVHEKRVGLELGEALARADADFVKNVTGFSIGGVAPLGHPAPLTTVIDEAFFAYETVWAAAGHPRSVFEITPIDLERATGARRMAVR